jgi:hypothetical protein
MSIYRILEKGNDLDFFWLNVCEMKIQRNFVVLWVKDQPGEKTLVLNAWKLSILGDTSVHLVLLYLFYNIISLIKIFRPFCEAIYPMGKI